MDKNQAEEKLKRINEEHLLKYWNNLPFTYQQQLLNQIEQLDIQIFQKQQTMLHHPSSIEQQKIEPYRDAAFSGNHEDFLEGKRLIEKGKTGCILVAGGQGTRLRFDGPKGMFPVTRIKHKSLFQIFAEKVVAASKQANFPLPLAIMTSPINDAITREFFATNGNFGLLKEQLYFFSQKALPFLDIDGHMFLSSPHSIAEGPNGNGYALRYFFESGIWQFWSELGIEYINLVPIDNPLANPYDAELFGYHTRTGAEITLKSILRKEPQEKVGLIVKLEGKPAVIEYTELPMQERSARTTEGGLKHNIANISLFCLSMDFVKHVSDKPLPLHANFKTAQYIDEQGITERPLEPNAWKFETFIFDYLPFAKQIECLVYPRKECFAPLKNAEGPSSLGSVQEAIQESDLRIVKEFSESEPPNIPFELAQDFYYPTPYLLSVWKDRPFPNIPYITEGS